MILVLAGWFGLGVVNRARAVETLAANDTIAICGDSITEQKLYSVFVEDYLLMCQPVNLGPVVQLGWGGESMQGLLDRLSSDVLPFRPTVATLFYGMNDGEYRPSNPITVAGFHDKLAVAIRTLRAGGARCVLVCSPGAVDTEKFKSWYLAKCSPEVYNQTLDDLGQAARIAAGEEGGLWVDVHGAMLAAMAKAKAKYGIAYPFAADGVHPSFNGHLVIAHAFLTALGCTGDIGVITFDAQTAEATATAGHKIIDVTAQQITIESTRYPFCFIDDPRNPESTATILDCLPFNEKLNRFLLKVSHAAERTKVTWGGESRVFSATELAAGVNLAAAFHLSPFRDAFASVDSGVRMRQAYQTMAAKEMLHSLSAWRRNFPERGAEFDELQAEVLRSDRKLNAGNRDLIRPVRHVILIESLPTASAQ